jgi:hypothetical protein
MTRLPKVGGDSGTWGDVLNDFLAQAHDDDGTLKTDTVGAPQLKPTSVTSAAIADGHVTEAKLANGAVGSTKIQDGAVGTNQLADDSVTATKLQGAGQALGLATLDVDGKLPEDQVPTRLTADELNATFVQGIEDDESDIGQALATKVVDLSDRATIMGEPSVAIHDTAQPYTAWPYGCLFEDQATERLCVAYTAGSGHVANDKVVRFRRFGYLNPTSAWGGAVTIADRTAEGLGATVHAAGKLPNGDYIAIVRFTEADGATINSTWLYRSSDQGATWSGAQWKDSANANLNPEEAGAIFVTASGAILTYCRAANGDSYIMRSTSASGANNSWNRINIARPGGTVPLEGGFVQIPDGTIICVVRRSIDSAPYTALKSALFTTSPDDGLTWATLADTDIPDMSNNPAALIYHADSDVVEVHYSSRYAHGADGRGSLYQSVTTPALAKQGKFGVPARVGTMASTRDNGYVAAVRTKDGAVHRLHYAGGSTYTNILHSIGYRKGVRGVAASFRRGVLADPNTGDPHLVPGAAGSGTAVMLDVRQRHTNEPAAVGYRFGNFIAWGPETANLAPVLVSDGTSSPGRGTNSWQTVDAAALLTTKYAAGNTAGYWLEVIFEIASNTEQSITFSLNGGTDRTPTRIIRKNGDTNARRENVNIWVPCKTTNGPGTATVGGFQIALSDYTKFTFLAIRALGYFALG